MIQVIANWFASLRWIDFLDILLVVVVIYQVYRLIKGTGAHKIFIGLLTIIVLWRLADYLNLSITAEIFSQIVSVGAIAIVIIFQPEIRRFLQLFNTRTVTFIEKGRKRFSFFRFFLKDTAKSKLNISAIVEACSQMSKDYTGALIVIANDNELEYPVSTGERINATVSAQLLETIFYKNTPLHDGAVIISHNKILAARCILPLSASPNIPVNLGLRHRSAIGITEQSDAFAIVVSEQTGKISFVKAGRIRRNITPGRLTELLSGDFSNTDEKQDLI
ncbi:MAG: diadenylate cyclase CdaA [Bacteroidales bacterium]|nr:diadenylate cyclase CdaA [Bacteroidales bacterium]